MEAACQGLAAALQGARALTLRSVRGQEPAHVPALGHGLHRVAAVVAAHEVDGLFQVYARLKEDGYAILFITHKLPEVMAAADRITVLRRGRVAGELLRAAATEQAIIRLMLGAEPPGSRNSSTSPA